MRLLRFIRAGNSASVNIEFPTKCQISSCPFLTADPSELPFLFSEWLLSLICIPLETMFCCRGVVVLCAARSLKLSAWSKFTKCSIVIVDFFELKFVWICARTYSRIMVELDFSSNGEFFINFTLWCCACQPPLREGGIDILHDHPAVRIIESLF